MAATASRAGSMSAAQQALLHVGKAALCRPHVADRQLREDEDRLWSKVEEGEGLLCGWEYASSPTTSIDGVVTGDHVAIAAPRPRGSSFGKPVLPRDWRRISGDRRSLLEQLFELLDVDSTGRLASEAMQRIAEMTGIIDQDQADAWAQHYVQLCGLYNVDAKKGLDMRQFLQVLSDVGGSFFFKDEQLSTVVETLVSEQEDSDEEEEEEDDDDEEEYKLLEKSPEVGSIMLVLYEDDVWYRVRVTESRGQFANVVHVDSGDTDEVNFVTDYVRLPEDDEEEQADEESESDNESVSEGQASESDGESTSKEDELESEQEDEEESEEEELEEDETDREEESECLEEAALEDEQENEEDEQEETQVAQEAAAADMEKKVSKDSCSEPGSPCSASTCSGDSKADTDSNFTVDTDNDHFDEEVVQKGNGSIRDEVSGQDTMIADTMIAVHVNVHAA